MVKSLFYFGHRLYRHTRCYRLKKAKEGLKEWLHVPSTYYESKRSVNLLHPGESQLWAQTSVCAYRGAETGRFWKLVYQHHSQHVHTYIHAHAREKRHKL